MAYYHRKSKNIPGKLIASVQFIASVIAAILVWHSGMLPVKYLALLAIVLAVFCTITFSMQFMRRWANIAGSILSIILSVLLATGCVYFNKVDLTLGDIGGATYKTDNMIVVVKKDDPAKRITDAYNYRFGIQTAVDRDNTDKMIENIEFAIGRNPKVAEYDTVKDLAQALLEGRVSAAIYNEAFNSVIDESIEGYSDEVRILYQYGIETELEQEDTNVEEPFHVYISGVDVSGPITTTSRSDVNIIMTVNPKSKHIMLTTTPRDYYVPIPGVSGEARDKLTHAGIYGVDASMAALEELYGIDISYYARVNFTSLVTIVDVLGGIDVHSSYAFEAGEYSFQEGINHLDGKAALAFSRERYSFADGDNQRGKNQEAVLTAILQKAMSPAILTDTGAILESVGDSVETNMTKEEMAKLIQMQLSDGASWTIESQAASGTGDNQSCYSSGAQLLYVMWPDEEAVAELSDKMQRVLSEK